MRGVGSPVRILYHKFKNFKNTLDKIYVVTYNIIKIKIRKKKEKIKMEKRGRGYIGNQMSVNAKTAYTQDEKPLSKWTKKLILSEISEMLENEEKTIDGIEKVSKQELIKKFLKYSSWHHTSAMYNTTRFYKIDKSKVLEIARDLTQDEIQEKEIKAKEELKEINKRIEENKKLQERLDSIEKEKQDFFKKYGFKKDSIANYIRLNPYTERISKKGIELVEFYFQGKKYVVEKSRINSTTLYGFEG